jgi:formate/nitrite transporter FocA (FNT family)
VRLAVWLCFSARDVSGKILAIVWPISAFVALGFEHSVANMYLTPIGMLAGAGFDIGGFAHSLFWVMLGNIVGGAGGVALVYWTIYLRSSALGSATPDPTERLSAPPIAAGDNGR